MRVVNIGFQTKFGEFTHDMHVNVVYEKNRHCLRTGHFASSFSVIAAGEMFLRDSI